MATVTLTDGYAYLAAAATTQTLTNGYAYLAAAATTQTLTNGYEYKPGAELMGYTYRDARPVTFLIL